MSSFYQPDLSRCKKLRSLSCLIQKSRAFILPTFKLIAFVRFRLDSNFNDLQWSSMIFNDLQWPSRIFNDLQWSSMIFNDLQWSSRPSMTFNDLQWSSMIVNDFQWSALISPEIWWHLIKLEIFIRFHSMFWCCLARVFKMFFLLIDILRTYKFQGHFMILHQLSQLCWFPKVLCDRKFTSPLFRMFCLIDYTGLTLTSFPPGPKKKHCKDLKRSKCGFPVQLHGLDTTVECSAARWRGSKN